MTQLYIKDDDIPQCRAAKEGRGTITKTGLDLTGQMAVVCGVPSQVLEGQDRYHGYSGLVTFQV